MYCHNNSGDVYCPTCRNQKCVYISMKKRPSFYDCSKCKACSHLLEIAFMDQKLTFMSVGSDGTHCFARKTSRDYEKEKPALLFEGIPPSVTIKHTRSWAQKLKIFHLGHNRVDSPLYSQPNFISIPISYIFSLQYSNMILTVSNDGFEWSLELRADTAILTVKDLV